jgi:hypothetical protein
MAADLSGSSGNGSANTHPMKSSTESRFGISPESRRSCVLPRLIFFAPLQKGMHPPEAPVAANGKRFFVAWTCSNGDDCGGNNITIYFDSVAGVAQVCLRSEGSDGKVQDLWLANGEARPLAINGCAVGKESLLRP